MLIPPHVSDFGCGRCGDNLETVPKDDTASDLLLQAANEFARVRRKLLPRSGIRTSVCSARRCLHALQQGYTKRATDYLDLAVKRDPEHWDAFAALIRATIAEALQ